MDLSTASKPLRIGLFGGAFDPPHLAHLALAQAALDQLELDVLHVVPTGDAWHKPRHLTAASHRLAMAHLVFQDMPQVVVDDMEIQRSGPSYTVDTLALLKKKYPDSLFFLIMGADQAAHFSQWHDWEQIVQWAQLAIADRVLDKASETTLHEWHNPEHAKCVRLHMPLMPFSATDVRQQFATGAALETVLSPAVSQYIQLHHLYGQP